MLDPRSNEFWNCVTDLCPLVFFAASAYSTVSTNNPAFWLAPAHLRGAFVATSIFTCLQHVFSLIAHTFQCVSPRLSHTIWYLDYMGIALNFLWNAPMVAAVALGVEQAKENDDDGRIGATAAALPPSRICSVLGVAVGGGWSCAASGIWWGWILANVLATIPIVVWTVKLAATHNPLSPPSEASPSSSLSSTPAKVATSWKAAAFQCGALSVVGVGSLVLPNILATAAAGFTADSRGLSLLFLLLVSLAVKELHFPDFIVWKLKGGSSSSSSNSTRGPTRGWWWRLLGGRSKSWVSTLRKRRGFFDFSPLHSHALWHCGVWFAQSLYLAMYSQYFSLILTKGLS